MVWFGIWNRSQFISWVQFGYDFLMPKHPLATVWLWFLYVKPYLGICLVDALADLGGCAWRAPPLRVPILSFWHTKCSKRNCLGSPHPLLRGPRPPYGKSWIRHWDGMVCLVHGLIIWYYFLNDTKFYSKIGIIWDFSKVINEKDEIKIIRQKFSFLSRKLMPGVHLQISNPIWNTIQLAKPFLKNHIVPTGYKLVSFDEFHIRYLASLPSNKLNCNNITWLTTRKKKSTSWNFLQVMWIHNMLVRV